MTQSLKDEPKKKTSPFRFATGLFAFTLLGQLFHGFNYSYFVMSGMIDVFLAAVCKVLFVITDSLNDLLFGMLSEKTKSRWGKRIPWIVGGAPFFIFFIVLCYLPDASFNWTSGGFFVYYLVFSLMIENCSTVLYINYNALFPVVFTSDGERAKTASFKHVLELVAMGVCYICTPLLAERLGSLMKVGILYSVVFLVVVIFCVTGIHQPDDALEIKTENRYRFVDTLKDVFHNKPFVMYNLTQSFFTAILGLLVSIYPMYCTYVLKVQDSLKLSILMGSFFGALLLSVPIWNLFIKKYGFRRCYKMSYTLLPFALLLLVLPRSFAEGLVTVLLVGPCAGGILITPDLMSTELIDIDKMKHGISREASFASMGGLISRFSLIVSAIVMTVVSLAFGYRDGEHVGPNPDLAFRMLAGVFLAVIAAIGALFCFYYIHISKSDSLALAEFKKSRLQAVEDDVSSASPDN